MYTGKNIAIIGFGKEGLSAANFLGSQNSISIFDDKRKEEISEEFFEKLTIENISFFFEGKTPQDSNFDYIVRSPGVRPDNKIISKISTPKTVVTSPTIIFFDLCPAKIIGVTGTKGKGTTTTLIYEILKKENKNVYIAGNIGTPMLEILPKLQKEDLVVLELSSFQLIDLKKSPQIAVVLMVTSEHLDWHKNKDEYQDSKKNIVRFQGGGDVVIINSDYPASVSFENVAKSQKYYFSKTKKTNGSYVEDGQIMTEIGTKQAICKLGDILLPGPHNIENVLAAVSASAVVGADPQNTKLAIQNFEGLPHRLQKVREVEGVTYYNDSFSTTPETTIAAISSFKSPKIIILGGSSKNSDFSEMGKIISKDKTVKGLILIGVEAGRIKESIKNLDGKKLLEGAKNIDQILDQAKSISSPGDIILFSPACASFDMFKNYQQRGLEFIDSVQKL